MNLSLVAGTWLIAIGAVDGAVSTGAEWHQGDSTTVGAHCFKHFPLLGATFATLVFACPTTIGATGRFVNEPAAGVELLFSSREDKLGLAIAAGKGFVLVHGYSS